MKILICGKGGSGKSTISALLAKEIAGKGKKVLVIDTDESNYGIHSHLGMDKPVDFMHYFGGKKVLFERTKTLKRKWKTDDLPDEYFTEKGNIKLMTIGKIYDFGEGCACPINALASRFLEVLELDENELLIADTDAGIEHFGRGVEKGCDAIFAVIEPSFESIRLGGKISELGEQVGRPVHYILNKVTDSSRETMLESIDQSKVRAVVPEDKAILKTGLIGQELSLNLESIRTLADFVITDISGT